jgi:hypothetical protein
MVLLYATLSHTLAEVLGMRYSTLDVLGRLQQSSAQISAVKLEKIDDVIRRTTQC